MKQLLLFALVSISLLTLSSFNNQKGETYSLTVEVKELQNSKGVVQFALFNKDGTIPDEDYKKCWKILKEKIQNGTSKVTFSNLPLGKYAVNILHDENENGEIDKGVIFPARYRITCPRYRRTCRRSLILPSSYLISCTPSFRTGTHFSNKEKHYK